MKRGALVILTITLAGGVPAAQDLDRLFKAAVNTETVDRNCKGAIDQYKKVAAGSNRALAAQALLRMAGCYQNLGDAEAQRIYERIVRDYGEQGDAVAIARTRLVRTDSPARSLGDRIVKAGPDTTSGDGRVSPNGRFISYVSYNGPKGLNMMLHDLASGMDRPITDVDWNGGSAYESAFSPDGKQLAYGWRTYGAPAVNELRVVNLEGTGIPQPRTIPINQEIAGVRPTDWSPDGKTLAVLVARRDGTSQIALVGTNGSFRALKSLEGWRTTNKILFSPDGKYLAYDIPASDTHQRRDVFIIAADASSETPLHDPADDVVMGWSLDGRHLLFASDRNGRVDLWAFSVSNGKPTTAAPTLVKPDIGTVLSQGLTASGALYTVKEASTVHIAVAPIDLERGTLTGAPVLQIFRTGYAPAWSPDGKLLAYPAIAANDQRYLAIRNVETNQVRELHPQLRYMPDPQWFPDGRSLLISGRDLKGRGMTLRVDVETGQQTILSNGGNLSPDGKKIYFADAPANRAGGVIEQDLATGARRTVFAKPDGTGSPRLSPDGQSIAVVRTPAVDSANPGGKTSTVIIAPVDGGSLRSVIVPAVLGTYRDVEWTPDSRNLLIAGSDPEPHLWLVPVNGGSPRKLDIDTSTWLTGQGIRLSPNGRQIAFFTGRAAREVWALENVIPPRQKETSRER